MFLPGFVRSCVLTATVVAPILAAEPLSAQTSDLGTRDVDAQGLRTRVHTAGLQEREPGEPVVIFQNGLGSTLDVWADVIDELDGFAPVVAYDRPGIGRSARSASAPTIPTSVEHLDALLHRLEAVPPYVLVGHSWGGVLSQRYGGGPDQVAGLVLVDPPDWTSASLTAVDRETLRGLGYREGAVDSLVAVNDSLTAEWAAAVGRAVASEPGILAEWRVVTDLWSTPVGDRPGSPALDVPTVVLLSGRIEPQPPFPASLVRAHRAARLASFSAFVRDLSEATLIFVTDAGHDIHIDDPGLVAAAIRRVVRAR